MKHALWGALAMSSFVAGLFFLRYFTRSRERLFLFFSLAFTVFGLNWVGLLVIPNPTETRHYVYLLRLVAFAFIIAGVVDKNRRGT